MEYEVRAAFAYRARAEELRTLADLDRVEETRHMLLTVADSYDEMAQNMDAIGEMNRMLGRKFGDRPMNDRPAD